MEFRLIYDGPLKSNRGAAEKQKLRRHFHVQLRELINRKFMDHIKRLIDEESDFATFVKLRGFRFAPLITERLTHVAKLNITLLTPEEPGRAITQGGDLDNRLKTLFDALRAPKTESELPSNEAPQSGEAPFFCLLEDDALISSVSVITDRLLRPNESPNTVVLLIHVVPESLAASLGSTIWVAG